MFHFDLNALLTWIGNGVVGLLLIYGLFVASGKRQKKEERRLEENLSLLKKNKLLVGRNRSLTEVNTFLENTMKRNEDRNQESQLARERLNGETVRRGSKIRSLELALHQERTKARGRR
jgi:hypothetical protein